jgi:hypothetical protein
METVQIGLKFTTDLGTDALVHLKSFQLPETDEEFSLSMGNCVARDVPDPQTGLTQNHIRAVRANWKLIEKRLPEYGLELFVA